MKIGDTLVVEKVREMGTAEWKLEMGKKKSLEIYREFKCQRGNVDDIYDNSMGSGLLADARAGVLLTQVQRKKFQDVNTMCRLCGLEEETLDHGVRSCQELGARDVDMGDALGLGGEWGEMRATKRRLAIWRRRNIIL